MATSMPREENDITNCSICLEQFKTPKYLPCLHTFCEACLDSYITSVFKESSSKTQTISTFNCPICRGPTKPPDPSTPYQEWARQFPLNHLMVTLIDQNKLKAKVKICDPCNSDNKETGAIMWCSDCSEAFCENCLKVHKNSRMSKNHLLHDINQIPAVSHITSLQCCKNHKGKYIDAFCVDYDQPCCTTCIAIHHRKCDHVTTLEEAADGISKSKTFADILNRLEESDKLINEILKEQKENVDDLEQQKRDIQDEMKNFRMKINKHLIKLESVLMQKMSHLHKKKILELTIMISDLENRQRVVQNCRNIMENCKSHASDTHAFLEMKKIAQRQKEHDEFLRESISAHRRLDYNFEMEQKLKELVSSVEIFGTVTVNQTCSLSETICPKLSKISLKDCIPKKFSSFSVCEKFGDTWVFGGIFLPDKSLLLALYDCKKLLKFSHTGDIIQQVNLHGYVCDVTMIDANTAAVTRYSDRAVDFVDVQTFTVTKSVSTGDYCYGIIYDNDKLYVACLNKILVLNKNGDKINEVRAKYGWKGITVIQNEDRKIVYVNYETHSCHFIRISDLKEIHTFTRKDLKYPRSVTSDRDGNVYIAGENSGNVIQLSAEGEFIRILLSGIDYPSAIQFDSDTNRFFVAHSSPSAVDFYELVPPE